MVVTLRLLVFLALGLVSHLAAAANSPGAGSASLPGVTLVEGGPARFLQRQPPDSIRVYAFHDNAPVPIPFQVDERDERESSVLDQGPSPNHDSPSGECDSNDAVVIMSRDLGSRGDPAQLLTDATAWGEIRVGGEAQPLGFAYVGVFAHPPALPSPGQAYARYESETERVYGERYALEFGAPLPTHVAF